MRQTLVYDMFDGGQSRDDALVVDVSAVKPEAMLNFTHSGIGNRSILHRNIEVDPNQHSFSFEVNVSNRQLICDRHGCGL